MITLNPEKGRASSEVLPLSRPSCSRPLGLEPVWAVSAKVLPLATEGTQGVREGHRPSCLRCVVPGEKRGEEGGVAEENLETTDKG